MIDTKMMRTTLLKLPKGKKYHIRRLQEIIKCAYGLDDDDKKPHTETRETHYPKWKHRLQGVMSSLKNAGVVDHDPEKHEYTFK